MEAMLTRISEFLSVQGWQVALLTVVVGLLTWALQNRSAHVRYLLWLIVLVKCVVPPVHTVHLPVLPQQTAGVSVLSEPAWMQPVGARGGPTQASRQSPPQISTDAIAPTVEPMTVKPQGIPQLPTMAWLGIAWAAGLGVFAVIVVVKALGTGLWLRRERKAPPESLAGEINSDLAALGISDTPRVWLIDGVGQPFVWGLVRASIYLPLGFGQMGDRQGRRNLVGHEVCHVLRRDAAVNGLQVMVQGVFWFHPFVWWANKRIRCEREKCCDEMAVARLGAEAKEYSTAIVNTLMSEHRSTQPVPSLAVAGPVNNIEERIKTMLKPGKRFYGRPSWAAAVGTLLVACVTVPSSLLLTTQAGERTGPATDKTAPVVPQADSAGAAEEAPLAGDSNVFVDPNTGIRFTKLKTISGPSDVIEYSAGLNLSPNGKFLLWEACVVPLDGSTPFDLNMPYAGRGSWSPDGRKVVFYAGAMWLIEVDPETGRPTGSARKLLEGEYWNQFPVRWSSDSQRIVFARRDSQIRDQIWTISIANDEASQVTDPFGFGLVSPDGKMVACSEGQGVMNQNSLLVKSVAGGEPRKIMDGVYPVAWSTDSEWIVCKPAVGGGWGDTIRFLRIADGREVTVGTHGYLIGQSAQGKKLLFYHGSYDYGKVLKVVSVAGGPPTELGSPSISFGSYFPGYQSWTSDSRSILVEGDRKDGNRGRGLWAVPLDGKNPRSLTIDTPLCRQAAERLFSPESSRLLLVVAGEDRTLDLWVVPISLARMESTGPPVKVFGGGVTLSHWGTWSPDGSKIAFIHKGDVWVASADGKSSTQLTKTPEQDAWSDWSPDGTMIAFGTQSPANTNTLVSVVPASGGEARVITDIRFRYDSPRFCAWSPDGKELTIASEPEGVISNFPISGGNARTVLRVKDMGIDQVRWLTWSPDGRLLAFQGRPEGGDRKLYVYQPDNAKLQRLSDNDDLAPWYWSPDSKWISYFSGKTVKTRPEGVLWEMDVEEALAKLAK